VHCWRALRGPKGERLPLLDGDVLGEIARFIDVPAECLTRPKGDLKEIVTGETLLLACCNLTQRAQLRFSIIAECVNRNGAAVCEGRRPTKICPSGENRRTFSGAQSGETSGAIILEIRLSLAGLISSGEPSVHMSHQWRFALLSRVLVPQPSQIKNSFFIKHQ
jgi:hypothetical protein